MNSELQAMMARRRRLAEGAGGAASRAGGAGGGGGAPSDEEDLAGSASPAASGAGPVPPSQVSGAPRARPIGGGRGGAAGGATASGSAAQAQPPPPVPRAAAAPPPPQPSSDDLQAIFERRRRLSETGAASVLPHSSSGGASGGGDGGTGRSPSDGGQPQLRVRIPPAAGKLPQQQQQQPHPPQRSPTSSRHSARTVPQSPPDAKSSPVKPELKKVAIDPALRAAMDKRRMRNLPVFQQGDGDDDGNDNDGEEEARRDGGGDAGGGIGAGEGRGVGKGSRGGKKPPSASSVSKGRDDAAAADGKSRAAAGAAAGNSIPPVPSIRSDDAAILQDDDGPDEEFRGKLSKETDRDSFDDFDQELRDLETPRPGAAAAGAPGGPPRLGVRTALAEPPKAAAAAPASRGGGGGGAPASTKSSRSDDAVLGDDEEDDDDDDLSGALATPQGPPPRPRSPAFEEAAAKKPAASEKKRRPPKEGREVDAMAMMATAAATAAPAREAAAEPQPAPAPNAAPQSASLQALHRRHRRRSVAGGSASGSGSSSGGEEEDDRSRADSTVASSASGTGGRSSTRRAGRRRQSASMIDGSSSLGGVAAATAVSTSRPTSRRQNSAMSLESESGAGSAESSSGGDDLPQRSPPQSHHHAPRPRDEPTEQHRRGGGDPQQRAAAKSREKQRRADYAKQGRNPSLRSMDSSDDAAQPPPKPRRDPSTSAAPAAAAAPPTEASSASSRAAPPAAAEAALDGWGDFASTFPSPDGGGNADAGGFFAGADANFSSFPVTANDATFGAFGELPSATETQAEKSPVQSASAFADFGTDDAFDFAFGGFETTTSVANSPTLVDSSPKKPAWDTSPLTNVPGRPPEEISLVTRTMFACSTMVGAPITNPMNGNIIFCKSGHGGAASLHEIDPRRGSVQVSSTAVVTPELQRRIATKFGASVCGLASVVALASGVHVANGQARLRVAAIVDLKAMESPQPMRVVAVWQWGYGSPNPISLQFTLTPPSGPEFAYEASTLQIADSVLFIGGYSPNGPCVFLCKPTLRETWSVNFVGGNGRITCMSVTPGTKRDYPYLAVGLSDRSVSVWTYKSALNVASSKANEPLKRWLFPLCRLDAGSAIMATEVTSLLQSSFDTNDSGVCTHLAWLPHQPSALSSILMLACSFQNGLAIFHVGLPLIADVSKGEFRAFPEPTQSTTLTQAPLIAPFSATRWQGRHEKSSVTWFHHGPHASPSVAVLLHSIQADGGSAIIALASLAYAVYRHVPSPKERTTSVEVIASARLEKDSEVFPLGLLYIGESQAFAPYGARAVYKISPSRLSDFLDPLVTMIGHPVSSDPPGLFSTGDPLLTDAVSDKDGVLHVFTVTQCDRQKSESNQNMQDWARPRQRHWLCRTLVGDTKLTSVAEELKGNRGFGGDESARGGASSEVVCELSDEKLDGLVPCRIVRCRGVCVCAVLFRPANGKQVASSMSRLSDAISIVIIDYSGPAHLIRVMAGRDIAFWPCEGAEGPCGVLLGLDGSTLSSFTWIASTKKCSLGDGFRPIVGIDSDAESSFVDCRRVLAFHGASRLCIGVLGTRFSDGKWCFLTGNLRPMTDVSFNRWDSLLPNIVDDSSLWLERGEEVSSVIGLEHDDSGYRNFAIATSSRVIIASSGMEIVASSPVSLPPASLAPLGSFAVSFFDGNKLRYLSCLDASLSSGAIATIPIPQCGMSNLHLVAVRPDRFLYSSIHQTARLVDYGQNPHTFLLPTATTKPALLLEPMVANAICVGGKEDKSTPTLRTVIEKFGRKIVSITHGDDEGIGNFGAGITPRTLEMLDRYSLKHAAAWLLTGTVRFERSSNTRILPSWLPLAPKVKGALNSDAFLHVVSSGDQYLTEHIKTPDGLPSALPTTGPIPYVCGDFAHHAIRKGLGYDALKSLDLTGSDSNERLILDLTMAVGLDRSKDVTPLLKAISGQEDSRAPRSSAATKPSAALAALAVCLKQGPVRGSNWMTQDQLDRWMKPLAPSIQRGTRTARPRHRLFGTTELEQAGGKPAEISDSVWVSPCNESKHVWNEGPRREKNNLLTLETIEEWLGRRRPTIVGKEGASAARDRGDKTLADILNKEDDDSFAGKSDLESERDGWIDGVGEGRSDEANLSCYLRMSEGADEDSPWRTEGIEDLSPFQNRAKIVGDPGTFSLQPTSSSVDEGEPGKVKALYDLVFDKSGVEAASGLAIPAFRGGSLDVGALHQPQKTTRHKCSIEFWFYVPAAENAQSEVVLARRTMGPNADDVSRACSGGDKEVALWELVLRPRGQLVFNTCAGASLTSTQRFVGPDTKSSQDDNSDHGTERQDLVQVGRWNHVCIVLNQERDTCTKCSVSIYMKGIEVASSDGLSLKPPGYDDDDLDSESDLDRLLKKSYLVMGLNHGAGFRLTEIRVWACERRAEDTQSLLYEYLTCAEAKKKFKVKISNKKSSGNFKGGLGAKGGMGPLGGSGKSMLAPTKSGALLATSKGFSLAPQRAKVAPSSVTTGQQQKPDEPAKAEPSRVAVDLSADSAPSASPTAMAAAAADFASAFGGLGEGTEPDLGFAAAAQEIASADVGKESRGENDEVLEEEEEEEDVPTTLWDTAVPLSQQVRSSAAAALIRGPPATRHFGGNRGGLPDFSGMDRFGVGGIAICGSEKTIVWRDNEDPPALTYPIGASGAVVSDLMDDEGSEFLCCFLAKEKRMVVFELQSRTVVVELQMTTKLNFWRFLPPEAAENTLCFVLVTPVGGFHWMPLEESPRPHQVWKRGPELQGKKVVSYEEGGSNGSDGPDILARVGLVMVTQASSSSSGGGPGSAALEAWIVPIDGDSVAGQVSDDVMGACLCQPPHAADDDDDGPFLPLLLTVHQLEEGIYVNVLSVTEPRRGSVKLGEIEVTRVIEETGFEDTSYEPPDLAMGSFPEAICCSLGNIVVIIIRRKGLIAAFELEGDDLSLIALEGVGHYVIDAVMRYSAEVGGAEIVMLLSDEANPKDGRIVSFCFRSTV